VQTFSFHITEDHVPGVSVMDVPSHNAETARIPARPSPTGIAQGILGAIPAEVGYGADLARGAAPEMRLAEI
jgi:hypothetical protein